MKELYQLMIFIFNPKYQDTYDIPEGLKAEEFNF